MFKHWALKGVLVLLVLNIVACQRQGSPEAEQPSTPSVDTPTLKLNNAKLEQADEDGQTVWEIQAQQASYEQNQQNATIENLTGNLFSDGELVMQVSAQRGEVLEDGEKIVLREQVTAIDPRNQVVLKGEELEWIPKENVVIIRNNLRGNNDNVQAQAKEGRYYPKEERVELIGETLARSQDPPLAMKAERLSWHVEKGIVSSNLPIQVNRFEEDTVTERFVADRAEINLNTQIVVLRENIRLDSMNPAIQMTGESATWNLESETIVSNQPLQLLHKTESLSLSGNSGQVDLRQQVARLRGGVQGVNSRQRGRLTANQLTWQMSSQQVQAEGNVVYRQQGNPPLTLSGSRAVGNLQSDNLVITSSNSNERVVTEIIPPPSQN